MAAPVHDVHCAPRHGETPALLLLFLVAVDGLGTILMLRGQNGFELNPLMDWLFGHGEAAFLLVKMLLTSLTVGWLLRRARGRARRLALLAGFAIYVPIVALHILNGAIVTRAVAL